MANDKNALGFDIIMPPISISSETSSLFVDYSKLTIELNEWLLIP
jgi:hypothetical protein